MMHMEEVTMHGHRISYREDGDPSAPALLLIHGITSSSATWDPVIPLLAQHSHVIAPDLLGHGDSDKPQADYSLGALASHLRDLLETLDIDSVTVMGHSLGGGVAMQFAYQYYAHCNRMILVSSGGLGREVSMALRIATLPGAEYVLPVIAHRSVREVGIAASKVLSHLPLRLRPSVAEAARGYASLSDSTARAAFVHTLRSVVGPSGQRVSAHDRHYLAEGRATQIVWGAHDTIIPVAHAYAAHEAIAGSELQIFEQSRHFPHRDEPDRFAAVVNEFLARTTPSELTRAAMRQRLAGGNGRTVSSNGTQSLP